METIIENNLETTKSRSSIWAQGSITAILGVETRYENNGFNRVLDALSPKFDYPRRSNFSHRS